MVIVLRQAWSHLCTLAGRPPDPCQGQWRLPIPRVGPSSGCQRGRKQPSNVTLGVGRHVVCFSQQVGGVRAGTSWAPGWEWEGDETFWFMGLVLHWRWADIIGSRGRGFACGGGGVELLGFRPRVLDEDQKPFKCTCHSHWVVVSYPRVYCEGIIFALRRNAESWICGISRKTNTQMFLNPI